MVLHSGEAKSTITTKLDNSIGLTSTGGVPYHARQSEVGKFTFRQVKLYN